SKEQREEGVTLIELLAVVVILGIISAIAVPAVSSAINNAKLNATLNDEGTIQVALQRYYNQMGYYPTKLNALTTSFTTRGNLKTGPYLPNQFPEADGFGNNFVYLAVGSKTPGAPGPTGYILVSGDGASLSALLTKSTALASGTPYIYAGGGVDASSNQVGSAPVLTTTPPTYSSTATWVDQ
ncbi:MAG: type II secretion system protein, partial [Bacilli bacterium]